MPKSIRTVVTKLNQLLKEFGSNDFSHDDTELYCKICKTIINSSKKSYVQQHVTSVKHRKNKTPNHTDSQGETADLELLKLNEKVSLNLNEASANAPEPKTPSSRFSGSNFNMELCRAFVDADIPLWKLQNTSFRSFLEKYMKREIPDESTVRKYYIEKCYKETVTTIRQNIADNNVWISIDETTDIKGRYIVNWFDGNRKKFECSFIFI